MDPSAAFANCQSQQKGDRGGTLAHDCHDHEKQYVINDDAAEEQARSKNDRGWRRIVLNFTPSWFSVNMGTGIVSILLHNLPYNGRWIHWISIVIFCLNTVLFLIFTIISILRYVMFKGLFMFMIRHPVQSLFVGTFPVAMATIINMIVLVCAPAWGSWVVTFAWALWWIDVVISIAVCCYLPFIIMHVHESDFSKMTALWLLPVVSTIVASATGGLVSGALPNAQHARWTIIISYILWGTGFPPALVVLVMYFHRLAVYHLPPREVIVSVFLPVGVLGQASFAIVLLGKVAMKIFPETNTIGEGSGKLFYYLGVYIALILWGYALVWLFFALASITRSKFPFNMGWWGFTFPLGVYALATTTLAESLPSKFLKVLGTTVSLIVVILWLVVSLKTTQRAITGKMFHAPCVHQYQNAVAAQKASAKEV